MLAEYASQMLPELAEEGAAILDTLRLAFVRAVTKCIPPAIEAPIKTSFASISCVLRRCAMRALWWRLIICCMI